jgi:hypothetical protein
MECILTAPYHTTGASRQLTLQSLHNEVIHPVAKRFNLYILDNFMSKSEHQHQSCFTLTYPPRLEVKKRVVVNLSDSSPMTAFHIIGKNLKLRLCIHFCIIGENDIVVFLVSQGTLGIGTDKDPTVKGTCRHIVEDSFEQLVTGTMGSSMIDADKIVDVLPFISQE